ncbi:hypothetical protein [Aquirhabdus parva]|uniref:Uncharacterized protein n=1 Tax=Aquirhabdus parva TaxID=2283318 RepID=A0A345P2C7_9GAMM|nr:hypothetical protein [Aquirhabdus parva]AXI01436.1 hypothetical protein HYN46_00075 [Aquirhabdus parva]AXI04382.1 hypothetical protein HYN46_16990 [Aquirhabdus parva]
MQQLPPIYRGDPFIYTGTYKPQGIATQITSDVILSASVCSKHGKTPLNLIINPDQVNNVGVFTISSNDTKHWHDQSFLTIEISVLGVATAPARAAFYVKEAPCHSHCR